MSLVLLNKRYKQKNGALQTKSFSLIPLFFFFYEHFYFSLPPPPPPFSLLFNDSCFEKWRKKKKKNHKHTGEKWKTKKLSLFAKKKSSQLGFIRNRIDLSKYQLYL